MTSNALRIFLWPTVTVLLSMSVGLSIYAMEFPVQKASELKIPQGFKAEKLIDVPGDYASLINFTFHKDGSSHRQLAKVYFESHQHLLAKQAEKHTSKD